MPLTPRELLEMAGKSKPPIVELVESGVPLLDDLSLLKSVRKSAESKARLVEKASRGETKQATVLASAGGRDRAIR